MTAPMTLTVDDRELIESLQKRTEWRDEFSAGTRDLLEQAADRLQSLLSERDKLREALRNIRTIAVASNIDGKSRNADIKHIASVALRSTDNG